MRVLSFACLYFLVTSLSSVGATHDEVDVQSIFGEEDPVIVPEGFCWVGGEPFTCDPLPLKPCPPPVLGVGPNLFIGNICEGNQQQGTGSAGAEVTLPAQTDASFRSDGSVWRIPCVVGAVCIPGGIDARGNATSCVADLTTVYGASFFFSGYANSDDPCIFTVEPENTASDE